MTDAPQHGKRKTPAQRKKLASLLAMDTPVGEALRAAGWSELQAKKGWDAVPCSVIATLPKKAQRLMALGKMDRYLVNELKVPTSLLPALVPLIDQRWFEDRLEAEVTNVLLDLEESE